MTSELKLKMAGLLPDRIVEDEGHFYWLNGKENDCRPIKESEWLYILHLIEEELHSHKESQDLYLIYLAEVCYRTKHSGQSIEFAMANATVEQRATAMCEAKGI